jgi:hypothetical protein
MLSFVSPVPSPLAADRNHRVFHFGNHHLQHLLGVRELRRISSPEEATQAAALSPEGSVLLYSNAVLARPPISAASSPAGMDRFFQCVAICRSKTVRVTNDDHLPLALPGAVFAHWNESANPPSYDIEGDACAPTGYGELYPVAVREAGGRAFQLERLSPHSFRVHGMRRAEINEGEKLSIRLFSIDRRFVAESARR